MKVDARRFKKVRDAVAVLVQIPDARDIDEEVKGYEDLDEEDKKFVQLTSKALIELVDGLMDKGGKKS